MIHLTGIDDITREQIVEILELAGKLKEKQKAGIEHHYLKGKTLGMIFEKSSTRTRVSFEVAMYQLGGNAIFLSSSDIQLGRGETVRDTAQVLSRYLDGIMIRTSAHSKVVELASNCQAPVINGLSDLEHPCQVLADIFTLKEKENELLNLKIAYVGDGNNVANSLIHICARFGIDISVATPKEFPCDKEIVNKAIEDSKHSGSRVYICNDPFEAVSEADAVYTDTWISMGNEDEKDKRINILKPFSVTEELMSSANQNALFMHCLPAYRGYEVSEEVIDGPRSIVLDQAENRLHVQKAILALLMKGYSWNC